VSAFLVLRRLLVIADPSIREAVLKQTYQGLVKGARNTTIHNIQGINLMKNTASELWGIDSTVGYTTGFGFVRQLAIHLRTSITNKTKDSYKTVYNWQYVHSLDFWSRVVAMHCESLREAEAGKPSPLRPLIYPIVQVTLGAMRLIPTAQYFPLRFQLVRSLLRIAQATATYIPLAPALVEVLNSAEMKKPPKPSTLKALEFSTTIRATKAYLRTRIYQDGVGEQVAELLAEFFVLWTKNIAFPELALPVIVMLKRWVKAMTKKASGNRNAKISSLIALLVQKLEANSRWIEEKRAKVEFAPNNRAGVEGFLKDVDEAKSPLGAFVAGQRRSREQKQKMLEDARKTEDRKRKEAEGRERQDGAGEFDDAESDSGEMEEDAELDGLSDEDLDMEEDDDDDDLEVESDDE
jgi:nucleolar complex protein 2